MTDTITDKRERGFFQIDNEIVENYLLSPYSGWLYCVISKYASKTGEAFPSLNTLAKEANMSKPSVIKHMAELERRNLIRVKRGKISAKKNAVNHYFLQPVVKNSDLEYLKVVNEINHVVNEVDRNKTQVNKKKDKDYSPLAKAEIPNSESTESEALSGKCARCGEVSHTIYDANNVKHLVCKCTTDEDMRTAGYVEVEHHFTDEDNEIMKAAGIGQERETVSLSALLEESKVNTCPVCLHEYHVLKTPDGTPHQMCNCKRPIELTHDRVYHPEGVGMAGLLVLRKSPEIVWNEPHSCSICEDELSENTEPLTTTSKIKEVETPNPFEDKNLPGAKVTPLVPDDKLPANDGRKVGRKPYVDPAIKAAIPPQNIKRTPRLDIGESELSLVPDIPEWFTDKHAAILAQSSQHVNHRYVTTAKIFGIQKLVNQLREKGYLAQDANKPNWYTLTHKGAAMVKSALVQAAIADGETAKAKVEKRKADKAKQPKSKPKRKRKDAPTELHAELQVIAEALAQCRYNVPYKDVHNGARWGILHTAKQFFDDGLGADDVRLIQDMVDSLGWSPMNPGTYYEKLQAARDWKAKQPKQTSRAASQELNIQVDEEFLG